VFRTAGFTPGRFVLAQLNAVKISATTTMSKVRQAMVAKLDMDAVPD
jgi:hypothetical protein